MAGGVRVEASSGPAPVEVVAGRSLPSASTPEVTAAGSRELVQSAQNVVDQLVASASERIESAVDEIMKIVGAAPTFFNDPGMKSQAIAKVIV
eukprot:1918472-Alexandrium_andersonii.AAC.1